MDCGCRACGECICFGPERVEEGYYIELHPRSWAVCPDCCQGWKIQPNVLVGSGFAGKKIFRCVWCENLILKRQDLDELDLYPSVSCSDFQWAWLDAEFSPSFDFELDWNSGPYLSRSELLLKLLPRDLINIVGDYLCHCVFEVENIRCDKRSGFSSCNVVIISKNAHKATRYINVEFVSVRHIFHHLL